MLSELTIGAQGSAALLFTKERRQPTYLQVGNLRENATEDILGLEVTRGRWGSGDTTYIRAAIDAGLRSLPILECMSIASSQSARNEIGCWGIDFRSFDCSAASEGSHHSGERWILAAPNISITR